MKDHSKPPVVVLSGVRWGFLWQRHQTLATLFARAGYPTVFVETTGLSRPRFRRESLKNALTRAARPNRSVEPEPGLTVYSPLVLPPVGTGSRLVNHRVFVPKVAREILSFCGGESPVVVAYPPTRTTLDLLDSLRPRAVLYDRSDEYDAFPGAPGDIASTEREILRRADLVCCTSEVLLQEVRPLRPDAFLCGPGVDYDLFSPVCGGGTDTPVRTVCYFGHLGPERLDLRVFDALAGAGVGIRLIGRVSGGARRIPGLRGVDFRGEVAQRELPRHLAGVDAFVLPYRLNRLTRAISPSKTFECLATGLPVVAAPLPALEGLGGLIYLSETPEEYVEALGRLEETPEKSRKRRELARGNSWGARFGEIEDALWRTLEG